jgi:hypothetical protein
MRLIKRYLFITAVIMPALFGQGLSKDSHIFKPSELVQKPTGLLNSFLDPNRFSMDHSYTLSFMSSGRHSTNLGMYLNTMTYQISDPLLMQLRVGYLHQPFGSMNSMPSSSNNTFFVQGAQLLYRPNKSLRISLEYQSIPSMMSPYYWDQW